MRAILPTFVDTKYNIIRSQERRLAKAVAKKVVKMPDITIWVFMVPFIFFFTLLKYRRTHETFVLNMLFTKRLALDAALDIVKKGQSRQDAVAQIDNKTQDILGADNKGIYSEKIRRKQMNEINLLLDHYLKLLGAEGNSYEALVKDAYQNRDNYEAFLRELVPVERAVNRAAIQTVGASETAYEIVSGMERATERIRAEQAEKIFP
ncbi:MAG TPA: NF038143 family protein [Dehalococcoidales bacterium]|nr:NF038143 family protein [Dehalococcoidales bacterium]